METNTYLKRKRDILFLIFDNMETGVFFARHFFSFFGHIEADVYFED